MPETAECHHDLHTASQQVIDVALVGNPNAGKTTVFNALTGLRQKVSNYPGVTVEKITGFLEKKHGAKIRIHDLPGLYSLVPKSLDDKIASDVISGRSNQVDNLRLVVIVVDASNLNRNLYLVTQVVELGLPVLIALNMMDAARAKGLQIDIEALAQKLNISVVPVIANRGQGIDELKESIRHLVKQSEEFFPPAGITLDVTLSEVIHPVATWIKRHSKLSEEACQFEAARVVSNDGAIENWRAVATGHAKQDYTSFLAKVRDARQRIEANGSQWGMLETELRYQWVDEICKEAVKQGTPRQGLSEKLDGILTHKVAGPILFLLIFAFIFQSIFTWAQIPMDAIDGFVSWVGGHVGTALPDWILPDLKDLLVNGVIGGVGAILVFLPQILFLFFFLSLLEDTGYMARVAFIMDRFMRGTGLTGRSVIPLLSSFACAIPGIMATRTISNARNRLVTIMIAPLMSCSARLPVYALMIGAFIPQKSVLAIFSLPGLTLLGMYLLGILGAIGAATAFKWFMNKNTRPPTFVMELPPYRLPSLKWTFLQVTERAKIFVTDAGKIILAISIVLWFLAYYPRPSAGTLPSQAIKNSYAGQLGHAIEPLIKPLGFDWKMGVALITSFAAREVLVSTMATIYNVEGANETSQSLRDKLRSERDPETGRAVYTPLVSLSLMVFFVFACQCMSTVAVVRRETNSWRWPLIMIVYMTTLAYVASLLTYQGGKLLGLG